MLKQKMPLSPLTHEIARVFMSSVRNRGRHQIYIYCYVTISHLQTSKMLESQDTELKMKTVTKLLKSLQQKMDIIREEIGNFSRNIIIILLKVNN